MIIVDSVTYDVPVISLRRTADFLDKYAERTLDGTLQRELIGVYYNYQLVLGATADPAEYESLWDVLTEATEFHTVTVPDGDNSTRTFTAYFASVSDELRRVRGSNNYWKGTTVNFIARSPARVPS